VRVDNRVPAESLLALASLATRADDPNLAAGEILSIIAGALGADSAALALLNPDSGKLETEASVGLPPSEETALAPGQGIPGWVAWHGKALLAADTANDPRYRALRPGVGCQMAAPLLSAEGEALGVVTLDRNAAGAYGPEELALLSRLTEEASRVLRRLWQLAHLQDKARQLETLLTTGQSLVSKLEQQELFDTLTRDTRHMMQARACALYLYDPAQGTVRFASYTGTAVAPPPPGELPLDSCLVAAAIHTRRAIGFSDIQSPEFHDLADLPRDGQLRSLLATPLASEGEVLGVLAIFTDRVRRFDNDEKRLCSALASLGAVALQHARLYARVFRSEESLRKNEQLTTLGLLAAEIAHEIRNPLTVLKLLLGGLGLDFAPEDPRRTDMRVIGEKLDQLEAIVTRVLNFAKAPSSLHSRCSLAEIVDDTLVLVRLKLAQNKIQILFEPPPRPLVVDGHKGQLQQVLLNLLINAMQAMPDGGTITLTLASDAPGGAPVAVLDVSDTGAGIPDEIRGRIFDSFLSGRSGGTGLGLSIAKRVLLGHHGDIALVATSPAGTTLRLTLPLVKN
jgi:signal transduction histidine kinase